MNLFNKEFANFIYELGPRTPWVECDFDCFWVNSEFGGKSNKKLPLVSVSIPPQGHAFKNLDELGGKISAEFLVNAPITATFLAKDIDKFYNPITGTAKDDPNKTGIYDDQLTDTGTLRLRFNKGTALVVVVNTLFDSSAYATEQDKIRHTFLNVAVTRPVMSNLTQLSSGLLMFNISFNYEDYFFEVITVEQTNRENINATQLLPGE